MDECDFFKLLLPMNDENQCSPHVDDEFRGIKIAMPANINMSDKGKIPIVGTIQVSGETDMKGGGKLKQHMVIVFVNKNTHQTFSFNMVPDKEPIKQDKSALPVSNLVPESDYIVNMYFAIDALYFYPDFPEISADYSVYTTVLDIKSNVIETKIAY